MYFTWLKEYVIHLFEKFRNFLGNQRINPSLLKLYLGVFMLTVVYLVFSFFSLQNNIHDLTNRVSILEDLTTNHENNWSDIFLEVRSNPGINTCFTEQFANKKDQLNSEEEGPREKRHSHSRHSRHSRHSGSRHSGSRHSRHSRRQKSPL